MTAKAISFRRGNTLENDEYVGVVGEITVDLGSSIDPETGNAKEDDGMATLRVHIDEETKGGIALARADFRNCNPANLTSGNEGLAFANLSNIKYSPATDIDEVKEVLGQYGIAHSDAGNLDTATLSPNSDNIPGNLIRPALARRDLSNVNIEKIAEENGDKNLAYANMSNVNTSNLADDSGKAEGKKLAYKDFSNITTAAIDKIKTSINYNDLVHKDLNGIEPNTIVGKINEATDSIIGYEQTSNRESVIDANSPSSFKYPTSYAVANYVQQQNDSNNVKKDLSNVTSWGGASLPNEHAYMYNATITNTGSNYSVDDTIYTTFKYNEQQTLTLEIKVESVDGSGRITKYSIDPVFGYQSTDSGNGFYTYTDAKGASFTISSSPIEGGGMALSDLSNVTEIHGDNLSIGYIGYNLEGNNLNATVQSLNKVQVNKVPQEGVPEEEWEEVETVTDISMTSSELDASGNLVSKIGVENVASNKGSGIIITQAGAYVNHNESTAMDDAHLIVKKQDLTSHTSNKNNPHNVTKAQVGLGNVDNTADLDKPISTAQQAALDLKANKSDTYTKAEVDAKVSSVYRFKGSVANQAALPTEGQTAGDAYNVEDTGANYAWTGSEWDKLSETIDLSGYATKTELNGKQNTLTPGEGISIVGNVISNTQTSAEWGKVTGTLSSQTDLQNALNAKVSLSNDETIAGTKTFTSSPVIPTPEANDNSTKAATTAWVNTAIEAALGTISTELASIIGE